MNKILREIKIDLAFLRGHTLQPAWFKVAKVFILLGVLLGYYFLFGFSATILFMAVFFGLMLVVHFIYRNKTKTYTQSWLDFTVPEDTEGGKPKRIGKYYYPFIILNASLAVLVSLWLT